MALIAGGVVGLNRYHVRSPAGLRTSITVSVGSALFVMLTLLARVVLNATNALSRSLQGITTGVGFIGSGVLFQQARGKHEITEIRGLTFSAAHWHTAALGTTAGCGYWCMTLVGTLPTLVVLSGFKRIKDAPAYKIHARRHRRTMPSATDDPTASRPGPDV